MSKNRKLASKIKKGINKVIMEELAKRGLRYSNMNQAAHDIAVVLNIPTDGVNPIELRRRVVTVITGKSTPDVRQVASIARKERKQKRRDDHNHGMMQPKLSVSSPIESDIKAFYASWEWKRLSYEVKMERGRACECCGATAPEVKIITDHVKPIRRYWHLRFEKTNLQVLCDSCNMGKGSWDETDFRKLNEDQKFRLEGIMDQLKIN